MRHSRSPLVSTFTPRLTPSLSTDSFRRALKSPPISSPSNETLATSLHSLTLSGPTGGLINPHTNSPQAPSLLANSSHMTPRSSNPFLSARKAAPVRTSLGWRCGQRYVLSSRNSISKLSRKAKGATMSRNGRIGWSKSILPTRGHYALF